VGLAPEHDVPYPAGMADALAQLEADIIAGTVSVTPPAEEG
jgi:hypothetical protein